MSVVVIRFGGSNCDRDTELALEHLGIEADIVWYADGLPDDVDGIVLPGGFSYGDYLRAGAMAAHAPIMDEVIEAVDAGVPVLGICNGAQISCEAGLTRGAFTTNEGARFRCDHVHIRVETTDSPWTAHLEEGDVLTIPIANGEGRFEANEATLAELEANDRILFRYCTPDGEITEAANPNGSVDNVAGIIGDKPHIAVMMPHPERATIDQLDLTDGQGILRGFSRANS